MTAGRKIRYAGAFLVLFPLIFSNPTYAKEQAIQNNQKKNIESILGNKDEHNDKNKSKNSISFGEYHFSSRARRLSNGAYSEITYEIPINRESDRLSLQLAGGYMRLTGTDVNDSRKEKLDVFERNTGPKCNILGPLYIKGGVSYFNYYLNAVKVPSAWGGYAGMGISSNKEKNPNFFFEVRQQFGDLNIDYPLMEDETNITGLLCGGGIKWKW